MFKICNQSKKSQHGCVRWALCEHRTSPCHDFACGKLRDDIFFLKAQKSFSTNFLAISGNFEQLWFFWFLTIFFCTPPKLFIFWVGGYPKIYFYDFSSSYTYLVVHTKFQNKQTNEQTNEQTNFKKCKRTDGRKAGRKECSFMYIDNVTERILTKPNFIIPTVQPIPGMRRYTDTLYRYQ